MTVGAASRIAGTLGFPSKMPGTSYGLPATACIAGAKLAQIPGTVCHGCYALSDRYQWTNALKAQHRRLAAIADPQWIDAMVRLLLHKHRNPRFRIDLGITCQRLARIGGTRYRYNEAGFHRWHDSGDLQSIEHLSAICEVARRTPKIRHWLPTQELGMVRRYLASGGTTPSNLVIRISGVMMNDPHRRAWSTTSSVYSTLPPKGAHICPAPQQDNRCGACRACWSPTIAHVAYRAH